MSSTALKSFLEKKGACSGALNWCEGKTFEEAWNTCERGDWILWIIRKLVGAGVSSPAQKLFWHAKADCAELVLPIFQKSFPDDNRVALCIQGIRDYADWKISVTDLVQLRIHCEDAAVAARRSSPTTAYAAACAAYAAAYAAVYAAVYAAYAAAYADAISDAISDAAAYGASTDATREQTLREQTLRTCADIIRRRLPFEIIKQFLPL